MSEGNDSATGSGDPVRGRDAVPRRGDMLALVVDDEPVVRGLLSRLLKTAGFRCIEASSAEEAYGLIDDHEPDIGVFDIVMPGMSGAELAWRLKHERPDLPLIAVSGQLNAWDPDDLADLGFDHVFTKPLDVGAFLAACHQVCGGESKGWSRGGSN